MKVPLSLSVGLIAFCVCWHDSHAFNPSLPSSSDCGQLKRQAETILDQLRHSCLMLQHCLVRRDTCLENGRPITQTLCEAANECMTTRENDFNDQAQCRYQWNTLNPVAPYCSLKSTALFVQDGCPGRFLQTNARSVDLNEFDLPARLSGYTVDVNTNCEGVNRTYQAQIFAISKTNQRISESCQYASADLGTRIARATRADACPTSTNFTAQSTGEFALPARNNLETGVHAGPRGAIEMPDANLTPIRIGPDTLTR